MSNFNRGEHHGGRGHDQPEQHNGRHRSRQQLVFREGGYGDRGHRSGALQWAVAVVFTVLAVVVLLAAVAVLIVVLLLQPRSPAIAVRSAALGALVYDQQGTLDDVALSLVVELRNGNARSAAAFSDLEVRVSFHGAALVRLRAAPVVVPRKGTLPLAYVARARGAPLDGAGGSAAMEAALRKGVVPFGVDGEARTAWKVAGVVGLRHWTRLACEISFFWPNGTALDFKCSSKSKFWFF
ncbi:hypothetical protein ACP70R_003003 [Stipagrostis hirtigluma subsp. patula]